MGKVIEEHHDLEAVWNMCLGQLSRGIHQRNHPFRNVAMATVGNEPNARKVVFRDFKQDPLSILVYTDYRSEKVQELQSNPMASFLFWHPTAKFQLKLKTEVTIHHKNDLAIQHYQTIGERGKESYNTDPAPGTKMIAEKNPEMPLRAEYHDADFCVLECKAKEMEALQLRKEGHIRARFNLESGDSSFIVP